jgi:hypothetical protein
VTVEDRHIFRRRRCLVRDQCITLGWIRDWVFREKRAPSCGLTRAGSGPRRQQLTASS